MGRLKFPNDVRLDLDDWTLAHVHTVMMSKLRRGESFHLSWRDDASIGNGRTMVWINPETSMVCILNRPVKDELDRAWLEALTITADSVGGLRILEEPVESESSNGREDSDGKVSV